MSNDADADSKFAAKQLVDHVEAMLRDQPDLDAAGREAMLGNLQAALDNGGIKTVSGTTDSILEDLSASLGQLQNDNIISASEQESLMSSFEAPMRTESVSRALEFARRIQEDGPESAREWLAAQPSGKDAPNAAAQAYVPAHVAKAIRRPARR